ncbi:hypothetical protein [Streptomyces sp. NPDC048650]|uniref:hypothetical protein n=1 Tax=unclassified Streptomyces TaxID=2593676 RepID=UPI00371FF643
MRTPSSSRGPARSPGRGGPLLRLGRVLRRGASSWRRPAVRKRGARHGVDTESRLAATGTDVSDEEWWQSRSSVLGEVVPDFRERFPLLVRLETEGAALRTDATEPYPECEARTAFEVGPDVIPDGIAATVDRAGP